MSTTSITVVVFSLELLGKRKFEKVDVDVPQTTSKLHVRGKTQLDAHEKIDSMNSKSIRAN